MKEKRRMITLPCNCNCCMLVISKSVWEDGDVNYNISIQDSRYDSHNTLWGRISGAAKILFGKPVYYNDLYLDGQETFQKLVEDMDALAKSNLDDGPLR